MVTCKLDTVAVPKMSSVRPHKQPPHAPASSSNSSAQRLLTDGSVDQLESASSVSRNSIYKLKIDLMFDDTRSIRSNRLDDPRGSHRTRSIIMYGRSELASTAGASSRSITSILQDSNSDAGKLLAESTQKDVRRISNSVQAQIEQLFTDVAKDATSSFAVTCLGALPLKDKVTSLQGLQVPLRELYMRELINERRKSGYLDICATGLRVKINASAMVTAANSKHGNNNIDTNTTNNNYRHSKDNTSIITANYGHNNDLDSDHSNNDNADYSDGHITPFHNIAVWSAVKFVLSDDDGGAAAFLPLITDPENIDKSMLFQPLSSLELQRVASNKHAPIFAVVMRSAGVPKVLECHGFICKSTEDAIVIAATLYQSLMAHVNANSQCSTKRRTPRNQNGVSCISIASSTAQTGSNYLTRSQLVSAGRKNSFRNSNASSRSTSVAGPNSSIGSRPAAPAATVMRSVRKKRISNSSLSCSSQVINEAPETTTEERKRRSHKTKRAPPIPVPSHALAADASVGGATASACATTPFSGAFSSDQQCCGRQASASAAHAGNSAARSRNNSRTSVERLYAPVSHQSQPPAKSMYHPTDAIYRAAEMRGAEPAAAAASAGNAVGVGMRCETNGDILTRVAIPRSGSFLNTGGLTRYKSAGSRRHNEKPDACDDADCGGGGGSPLGFSELFNEFRLHENLHSLDEILYAIIDADGMSFNDLKPIYKEFLLKLAVTLTKDELYQRSKNIMRRQKKKKLNRKISNAGPQKRPRILLFGTKGLKKVFQLDQFRSCRGKASKPPRHKEHCLDTKSERKAGAQLVIGPPMAITQQQEHLLQQQQRQRVATSGSDVSVSRHENGFSGLNRNSSSGYVSCSECSYDSEACTCAPAERCYCSLRNEHLGHKQRRKDALKAAASAGALQRTARESRQKQNSTSNIRLQQQQELSSSTPDSRSSGRNNRSSASSANNTNGNINRLSLISCKSDEKCYCSMVEEDLTSHDRGELLNGAEVEEEDASTNTQSDTTWCDTDSCLSASKCYCQRERRRPRTRSVTLSGREEPKHSVERTPRCSSRQRQSSGRSSRSRRSQKTANDQLALDYELFTIGGNRKSMQPHEALSMKKSVEAAAVFADVKLRQTTDIKSVCSSSTTTTTTTTTLTPPTPLKHTPSRRSDGSNVSRASSRKQQYALHSSNNNNPRCASQSSDGKNDATIICSAPGSYALKSHSADDLLTKLSTVHQAAVGCGASVRSCSVSKQRNRDFQHFSLREKNFTNVTNSYQSMKAVSASLEDTLGYLP